MSKKKTLLTILAVVLVCCIAVAGTLAVLTKASTSPVKNTFIAAGGGELAVGLELKEHQANKATNGTYSLDTTTEVTGNDYKVLPRTDLPKDPFIRINQKTEVPSYLYVEVVDTLGDNGLSYDINSKWIKLDGITGINGGAVYVYSEDGEAATIINDQNAPAGEVYILQNNTITVSDDLKLTGDTKIGLDFYGYLGQASVGDAAKAFTTCFNNK